MEGEKTEEEKRMIRMEKATYSFDERLSGFVEIRRIVYNTGNDSSIYIFHIVPILRRL